MELRVLRYFQAVATELNFSRAAEKLHVSQPTISRQLRDLENEIGVSLINRSGRSIELTNEGEYFSNQVNQILILADKTLDNMQKGQDITGSIVIGSAETRSFINIAQSIRKLKNKYPHIRVNIISTNANDVRRDLDSGNFDFGIVVDLTSKKDYEFIHLLGESRWGVLMPRTSNLANKDHLTLKDLENCNMIVTQQKGFMDALKDWYVESTNKFNIVATYNLLYNASLLVSAVVGYALCVDGIINTNQSDLIFVPLEPRRTAGTNLVWQKGRKLSQAAEAFLKQISSDIDK
ncbi:LysR family transcriptional regulator [Companilactobacillus paralimentarius]|uniref:LysR family transcriptional regulator n=1 Tax=Companilactobacillus paralimentarius TaxID=83526 RepID=UPI00384C566A